MANFAFIDPPAKQPITEIFAYVSIDDHGNEGVCGMNAGALGWVPMVFGNARLAEVVRPAAQMIATESGKVVRLVRFTTREELQALSPHGRAQ